MTRDPELKAMEDVLSALSPLDAEDQERVLSWVADRLHIAGSSKRGIDRTHNNNSPESGKEASIEFSSFDSASDVFAEVHCKTDQDRVLVMATYLQEHDNKPELTGKEINDDLKHMGHGIGNITQTIGYLMKRKPKLMIQTGRSGKRKKGALKLYKVTDSGLSLVKDMLSSGSDD
ncbi:MAG: hypothetical protein OXF52_02755 [Candidatus Dadabacteria bacterium]|nr:hypothetical protein [Candidatus Dadabacteria bacterium]